MIRSWSQGRNSALEVLAERESIYRLLAQATHNNLNKEHSNYTVDPTTRYPNLNVHFVQPSSVRNLYDTDEEISDVPSVSLEAPVDEISAPPKFVYQDNDTSKCIHIKDSQNFICDTFKIIFVDVDVGTLFSWAREHVEQMGLELENLLDIFAEGNALCIIIHRYRPDLISEFPLPPELEGEGMSPTEAAAFRNQLAFDILHKEYGFPLASVLVLVINVVFPFFGYSEVQR